MITDKAEEFLAFIKKECDSYGVKYLFPNTEKVSYNGNESIQVSGYFDNIPEPVLACAIGKSAHEWYQILIHESCHMDQWKEGSDIWNSMTKGELLADRVMDEWLMGKEYERNFVLECIRSMQNVELDCEKRSIEKIQRLQLPIDIKQYTKRANSYIYLYSVILETRKWPDIAPYNISEIVEQMPDYFFEKSEDYFNVSKQMINLYRDKCYNPENQ